MWTPSSRERRSSLLSLYSIRPCGEKVLKTTVPATLIAAFAGLLFGSAWTAAVGCYLFLTRSYRRVRNPIVIGLGYLLVGTVGIGSLLLLFSLCDVMGIARQSSPRDAALCAYTLSCTCVMFFVVRSEIRWRKSVGLDNKTLILNQRNKR